MAIAAKRVCSHPGCTAIAEGSRCPKHPAKAWESTTTSRQARGYGKTWDLIRAAVLLRDSWTCQLCKRVANQVDHIVNKARGGSDDPSNLQAICEICHKAKTAKERRAH